MFNFLCRILQQSTSHLVPFLLHFPRLLPCLQPTRNTRASGHRLEIFSFASFLFPLINSMSLTTYGRVSSSHFYYYYYPFYYPSSSSTSSSSSSYSSKLFPTPVSTADFCVVYTPVRLRAFLALSKCTYLNSYT